MPQDIERFVAWLKSAKRRMSVSDDDLLETFWQAHPRFHFFKSLPWGANLLDLGAGDGGLVHWKNWLKPQRPDLNLYGVDLSAGAHKDLYAGWESINLDREQPKFPGVKFNAFFAGHLLEYLGAPELLIEWLGTRADPVDQVYLEWINPVSLNLPTREQLHKNDIEVVSSNFIDDWGHKQAPDLGRLSGWLTAAGFELIASGAVDLGILGEELLARGADRDSRSMGYWSMTRSSLYAIAVKSGEPARLAPKDLEDWIGVSESIPSTTRGELARELARISFSLPPGATIIEIGAFLGGGTVVLAGPRKMRGSGKVHVIDPFDCSGEPRLAAMYKRHIELAGGRSPREHFEENIRSAGLCGWIEIHQGRADEIAARWTTPVDMIFFDGDTSPAGSREAYDSWARFLKPGGIVVIHGSGHSDPSSDPSGHDLVVAAEIHPPWYTEIRIVEAATIARVASERRGDSPVADPFPDQGAKSLPAPSRSGEIDFGDERK